MEARQYLTMQEACEIIQAKPTQIRALCNSGLIPHVRRAGKHHSRVFYDSLAENFRLHY